MESLLSSKFRHLAARFRYIGLKYAPKGGPKKEDREREKEKERKTYRKRNERGDPLVKRYSGGCS